MSYRNPKIIVDKSGSLISEAIASGVKEIANAFAKRKIRADKAGQIETNRLNKQSQERVDNANENAKNTAKLGTDVQVSGAKISNKLMENQQAMTQELEAGNVSNDRRMAIENQFIKIKSIQNNLNGLYVNLASSKENQATLEEDSEQFAEGRTAWNNDADGKPNVAMGLSAATAGLGPNSLNIELKNNPATGFATHIKVSGGGGGEDSNSKWSFEGSIAEVNEILSNPTHKITQLNDEARSFINKELYSDKKNTLNSGFIDENTEPIQETKPIKQSPGSGIKRPQYSLKTQYKLNEKANDAFEQMGDFGLATFTTASVQDQRSMLVNLGYTPDDVKELMMDLADTNEDTGVKKSFEARQKIKNEIIETELATSSSKMIIRKNIGTPEQPEYTYYQETSTIRDMNKEQLAAFDRLIKLDVTQK